MSLRSFGPLALAAAFLVAGCKDVDQDPPPSRIVVATFSSPAIPTPNDLAMAAANPNAVPPLPDGAQKELLTSFIEAGGFPVDQGPTLSVPIKALSYDAAANRYVAAAAPSVDPATITSATAALFKLGGGTTERIQIEGAATQVAGAINLVKVADATGSRRLAPGRYVFAVRGGREGVKTTDGVSISPDSAIALTIPNKDLSIGANQPLGGLDAAQVAQLESVRAVLWQRLDWSTVEPAPGVKAWAFAADPAITPAYEAIDGAFRRQEVASIAAFEIAPAAGVTPLTDSTSGQIPLPSDFLLDGTRPVPGDEGRFFVREVPAFGAAAEGLATLDGFSTTGLILSPLSGPIQAATIDNDSVLLFELPPTSGAQPRRLLDVVEAGGMGDYLTQPPDLNREVGGTAVTTAIGLQPAVPVPTMGGVIALPPLKERARYLVVVTDKVKDLSGSSIRRSTLGNLLWTFEGALADTSDPANPVSLVSGLSGADAAGLQALRDAVNPILAALPTLAPGAGVTRENVVMAYTITTQSVTGVSARLSALPYSVELEADQAVFSPGSASDLDTQATLGIPASSFPSVQRFVAATVTTVDALDPATGALDPDLATWGPAELAAHVAPIPALVAVPSAAALAAQPACPAPADALKCAPLVVFHHGLNGGHLQMLTVAQSLAAKGFVVAAIDAPYHGDRAFCAQSSDCSADGTAAGTDGVCTPDQARAGQGDAVPPGTCTTGTLRPSDNLSTIASGNYFISGNFFRIRDALRQGLIDQSALVLALARPPEVLPQPEQNPLRAELAGLGVAVDPTRVYYEGQSLGGIQGTALSATNPRVSRAVLAVPGGTLTDIFTTAPAFDAEVDALFLSLGIDRNLIPVDDAVAARYLQTLIVAKWILDPADPINYAAHVGEKIAEPDLVAALGPLASATTSGFGQLSRCDQVVPNATTVVDGSPLAYGDLLLDLAGVPTTLYSSDAAVDNCVPHGVLADTFSTPSIGLSVRDQAAQFLSDLSVPTAQVTLP